MEKKIEKLNEVQLLKAKLELEHAGILEESKHLRAKREALVAKIQPLEAELHALDQEIKAIERPRRQEVGRQIAQLARVSSKRA